MRYLSGGRFTFTVGWRVAAFVAISFAFPFIVPEIEAAIRSASECALTDSCAPVGLLTGTVLRLILLGLFALSLVRPVWRRSRSLGMPRIAGFLVPILFLLDWRFLTTLGGYWPVSFSNGLLNSGLPFFSILGVLILVLLATNKYPTEPGETMWRRHRVAGELGWLACLATVVLGAVASGLFLLWLSSMAQGVMLSPYAADSLRLGKAARIAALAAMVPFLWMLVAETLSRPARPSSPTALP